MFYHQKRELFTGNKSCPCLEYKVHLVAKQFCNCPTFLAELKTKGKTGMNMLCSFNHLQKYYCIQMGLILFHLYNHDYQFAL